MNRGYQQLKKKSRLKIYVPSISTRCWNLLESYIFINVTKPKSKQNHVIKVQMWGFSFSKCPILRLCGDVLIDFALASKDQY